MLTIGAGYQENEEFGSSGNRTGTKITAGTRFSTAASASVPATGQSYAALDSVSGIRVGDLVSFIATGGTPGTEVKKITQIDENLKRVYWSGDFSAAAAQLSVDDVVNVYGFRLQTYRKSISGIEKEVDVQLGKVWCTMEPEVSEFYAPNVFATSKWLSLTDEASVSTLADRFLSTESTVTYPTNGADGTSFSTLSQFSFMIDLFDDLPIRFLTQTMSTLQVINEAGETYCKGRWDNPLWMYNIPENQTKAQLITLGNNYQRSDDVIGVVTAHWLKVSDPFSTSAIAPPRNVPNVGHVMGAWCRSIGLYGVHFVPAVKQNPIFGTVGIVGDQFLDDNDRTDIAEAGINLIQEITGAGVVIRNFFTPSTETAYQFANGLLMRNFLKVSSVDSLQTSENTPNSINRVREDKMAILQFLYRLWDVGSTGNVPTGETFGQTQNTDGSLSTPDQHFQVQADAVNNPQSSLNAGERNLDVYYTYPAPAGSIKIGVGIQLSA
jgi:hypothetical protein